MFLLLKIGMIKRGLLDKKIDDVPIVKDRDDKKIKSKDAGRGIFKIKKSFFKIKKPSGGKVVDSGQKEIVSDKLRSRSGFRVENIPRGDFDQDEVGLVDERIKESPGVVRMR